MVQVTAGTSAGSGAGDIGKAEDAASASGNTGVAVLGVRNDALATLTDTDADYTMLSASQKGALVIQTAGTQVADGALGNTNSVYDMSGNARVPAMAQYAFNNSTLDRIRNNFETTVGITASGVTTTQTGTDQTNYNHRGLTVVLDMTVVGTGSVTLSIQGKDSTSGKYYTILAGAAVVTNSTNRYTVYPGITVAANVSASDILPRTWRIVVTANNANATTYTVAANLIV